MLSTAARIAAANAKGVTRRTTSRVHEAGTPLLGKTPEPSPPLAGWNVRRAHSLRTEGPRSAALEALLSETPPCLVGPPRRAAPTSRRRSLQPPEREHRHVV